MTRTPPGWSLARLSAAFCVAAAPLLLARQQEPPVFRSNTRLIEVSVVVTGRDRKPVEGLTAADFQVFDDGKPQKVELFAIEAAATAAAAPAPAPVPSRPPREFSNDVTGIGSVTVIVLDQLNSPNTDKMFAREHLRRFLEQIKPEDRVGLYVLDGNGVLRVVHDFTSDASALVRAIAKLREGTSRALAGERDAAHVSELAGDAQNTSGIEDLLKGSEPGSKAMKEHYQGSRSVDTMDALESIGHHLSGIWQRKNLIWISSAFPLQAFGYAGRSATSEISRATRALNDANVALYAIDARGLVAAFASQGRLTVPTLSMIQGNQDILQSLSEQTGGRAFVNTNDLKGAIRHAIDDGRMTYVLGYYPSEDRWNGRFHRITVKVNRPGLELRHRAGYYAVATARQVGAQRKNALNAAVQSPIDASALGLTVGVEPVPGRSTDYRVTVRIHPGAIGLERTGTAFRGAVDIVVAQVRADGAEGRSLDRRADINVPAARLSQFLRDGVSVDHAFTLIPEAERLRVVVRDTRTGAVGAIGISREQLLALARH